MAYISNAEFDHWSNHKAYYKIFVAGCEPGERYYNCIVCNGNPKNSCSRSCPEGSNYHQSCYVRGRAIDYGGKSYLLELRKGSCSGILEDSTYIYIPSDPDNCEVYCQTYCEVSCQSSCESSCQTHCQHACQTTCQLACQTACEITSQFCGRDCGRSVGR